MGWCVAAAPGTQADLLFGFAHRGDAVLQAPLEAHLRGRGTSEFLGEDDRVPAD